MKQQILQISLSLILLLAGVSTTPGQTLDLAWDPNPEPDLAGYRLYYQAGSPQPPFLGYEATQGDSPIDAGDTTSLQVELPDDGRVYYFSVTAYDASGYESAYSNIVANRPRPNLVAPEQWSRDVGTSVTFDWYHEKVDPDITYTLVYGAETDLLAASMCGDRPAVVGSGWLIGLLLVAGLCVMVGRKISWTPALATGLLGACLVTACGGGGGVVDGPALPSAGSGSGSEVEIPGVTTQVVAGLNYQYYVATDLAPGQTYYWKVLAVDSLGQVVESDIFSFTTDN